MHPVRPNIIPVRGPSLFDLPTASHVVRVTNGSQSTPPWMQPNDIEYDFRELIETLFSHARLVLENMNLINVHDHGRIPANCRLCRAFLIEINRLERELQETREELERVRARRLSEIRSAYLAGAEWTLDRIDEQTTHARRVLADLRQELKCQQTTVVTQLNDVVVYGS